MTSAVAVAPLEVLRVGPWWKKLIGWGTVTLLGVTAIWWLTPRVLSPFEYFHVHTVQLDGARFLGAADVTRALGIDTSASIFVDARRVEARLAQHPLVAAATIRRKLPGTLVVEVTERTPVALRPATGGFQAIDVDGRRLPIDPAVTVVDAPVVTTASTMRDSSADRALFALLGRVRSDDPVLFDRIDEVRRVSATEWQLTLGRLRVRVSPEVTVARLADIFPVESDLARKKIASAELDLRYRNLVIARLP
jgi:cell division protein FtsQ